MKFLTLFTVFMLSTLTNAAGYRKRTEGEYIGMACKNALTNTAKFCKVDYVNDYSCQCVSIDAIGSYIYCGYEQTSNSRERKEFEKFYHKQCPNVTIESMPALFDNVSNYMVNVSNVQGFNKSAPAHFPVFYNKTTFHIAYNVVRARYIHYDYAMDIGYGLVGFWGLVLLCGIVTNFMSKFAPNLLLSINNSASSWAPVRLFRKHVSIPATFGLSHTNNVWLGGLLPTRLESLVIFVFFALNIILESVKYSYVAHNYVLRGGKGAQLSFYIAARTGVVSMFLMCLTFLFGGRNNFMIWLTGWKQSTFMTYHKWVARTLILTVVVHSLGFLRYLAIRKVLDIYLTLDWYIWGCVATVACSIMWIQAFSWLRVNFYETFLNLHIIMAVFFLVGTWKHVDWFGYTQWCYATAAVWSFDRFVRLVRIIHFGIRTAKVTVVSDETLEIVVPKHNWWPTFPGAFGYVYFMRTSLFWQSHPFCFVDSDENHIKFFVKVKNGATKSIYKYLMTQPNFTADLKIAVEGPYGDHKPVATYDQVLLYSGGNGIPGPYSYAKDLCQAKEKSKVQFTKFYWIIRHWYSLDWFLEELKSLQSYDKLQTIVYVTKYEEGKVGDKFAVDSSASNSSVDGEKRSDDIKESSESWLEPIQAALPHVEFRQGRPNIEQIVVEDLAEIQGSNVAVMTCGHPVMCDEIRKVVADQVGECKSGRIDLIEELQTW